MGTRNVVIVMGRCTVSRQGFGVRFERHGRNQWVATWAFGIREATAKREGYGQTRMDGHFVIGDGFPGCPYCSGRGFWLCTCGRIACWNREVRQVICPWCSQHNELAHEITSLQGSRDV